VGRISQEVYLPVIEIYKILLSGRLFFARDETLTAT
jgi:hypothetical protein